MRVWSAVLCNVLLLTACFSGSLRVATSHDSISGARSTQRSETSSELRARIPIAGDVRVRFHVVFREDGARWDDDEVIAVREALALLDKRELAEIALRPSWRRGSITVTT